MKVRKLRMNKRGSFPDILILGVVFFAIVIAIFGLAKGWSAMSTELNDSGMLSSTPESGEAVGHMNTTMDGFNYLLPLLFFGASLVIIIMAWFINLHPGVAFVMLVLFLVVIGAVSMLLGQSFDHVIEEPSFADEVDTYNTPVTLIKYMPLWAGAMIMIVGVVLYAKWKGGGR